jgi:hypothetical protein
VESAATQPRIPESFLEHRQVSSEPWVDQWIIPSPFVSALFASLRTTGVDLTDFSFNNNATNVGENHLNVAIRKLNAAIRIGLDAITFIAANPDWGMAPELIRVFDQSAEQIWKMLHRVPDSQEATLAFHVTSGTTDFRANTASLVNPKLVGDSLFCGIALHRADGALMIDKSLRHDGAAFVRLQRRFPGNTRFSEVASRLYEDEVFALRLLGIEDIP